jgi:hypothetical protein
MRTDTEPRDAEGHTDWEAVRDSWVGAHEDPPMPDDVVKLRAPPPSFRAPQPPPPPSSRRVATVPPPLPGAKEDARLATMLELLATNDYEGARLAAEGVLAQDPACRDAVDGWEMSASELRKSYVRRLGSLDRVPMLSKPLAELLAYGFDARTFVVLGRVDGLAPLSSIASADGVEPLDALRILSELYLRKLIALDP